MACCSSMLPQPCAMLFGMPGEGEAEGYRVRAGARAIGLELGLGL